MKKAFLVVMAFFFVTIQSLMATHIIGGDITYRFIGDSTGIANNYEIQVNLYSDLSLSGLPNQLPIRICSSCYSESSISLPKVGGGITTIHPSLFDCVDSSLAGTLTLGYTVYRGVTSLPGPCSDWVFRYGVCCRTFAIDNLVIDGYSGFFLGTELNNEYGNHSSIQFTDASLRTLAANKAVSINFGGINTTQDSVSYQLRTPQNWVSNSPGCTHAPLLYNTGYSSAQPISVSASQPAIFDASTGVLTVKPDAVGIYQVAVSAQKYHFDSVDVAWKQIGSSLIDVPVVVAATLSAQQQLGTVWDSNHGAVNLDTATGEFSIDLDCADTLIPLHYLNHVNCLTVAPDASDFWMLDPDKNPFPLVEASSGCGTFYRDKEVKVKPAFPFTKNGRYVLRHKVGNDGNSIVTYCGEEATGNDSLIINVKGCSGIGLEERRLLETKVYPNPTQTFVHFEQAGLASFYSYELRGLTGRLLLKGKGTQLDLSTLNPGVFLITLEKEGYFATFRIVKQ